MKTQKVDLKTFAKRFLTGRINWYNIPRMGVTNFGNMISFILYREGQYQVELFICPHQHSDFTVHRHPDVDTYEFPLCGDNHLFLNGKEVYTIKETEAWLANPNLQSQLVPIMHDDWHSGGGHTMYAFLSIQHWLNGVEPSSVGLNWIGEPSSLEQKALWLEKEVSYG